MLTLRIPKIVELANPKLTVLYRVSVVVIIVPFAVRSVVQREYDAKQPMSDSFGFSLNVRPLTVDQIRKVNKDWRSSEHCREPKRYNFVADSHRAYVNHSCVPICATKMASECVVAEELYDQVSPDSVVLYTHLREVNFGGDLNVTSSKLSFLPGGDAFEIGITYNPGKNQSLSPLKIPTLVMQGGDVLSTWGPGKPLVMTMQDVLNIAGTTGKLNAERRGMVRNELEQAAHMNPIGYLTGLDLVLVLDCWSAYMMKLRYSSPVCTWTAHVLPTPWVSFRRTWRWGNSAFIRQEFHGVRLTCKAGRHHFISVFPILNTLLTITVLMQFPTKIARFVACFLLGPLSNVYSRLIFERFKEREQIAALATRLMNNNLLYLELKDSKRGITKRRMLSALHSALEDLPTDSHLGEQEIMNFTDYCFRSIVHNQNAFHEEHGLASGVLNDLRESCSAGKSLFVERQMSDLSRQEAINGYFYNTSLGSAEKISFQDMIHIFKKHRTIGKLERAFMPSEMKRYIIGAGEDHGGDVSAIMNEMKSPFSRVRKKRSKSKTNVESGEDGKEVKDTSDDTRSENALIALGPPEEDHPTETKGQVSVQGLQEIIQSMRSSQQSDLKDSEMSDSDASEVESLRIEMNNKLHTLEERVIMRLDSLREQLDGHVQVVEEHRQQVQQNHEKICHLHEKFAEPPKMPQQEPPDLNYQKADWASDVFVQLRDAQQRLTLIDKDMLLVRHNLAELQARQKLTPVVMEKVVRNVSCAPQMVGRTLSRDGPERAHSLDGSERMHSRERADRAHSRDRALRGHSRDRADRVRSRDWPERDELSPVSEHQAVEDPGVLPMRQFSASLCGNDDWSPKALPSNHFPESTPKVIVGKLDLKSMATPRSSRSDSSFVRLWQAEMAQQSERASNAPMSGSFRLSSITSFR